jgi:tRNA (guanine37-N1)-methyltransferase
MTAPWRATVLTLFPEMFPGALGLSLAGKALADAKWALEIIDIRGFATDKHRSVDDTPSGGGAGMVMRADIASAAIDAARASLPPDTPTIYLSPRGRPLTQARARELAAGPGAILLAGRFEGVDERVLEARQLEEVSIGDYVLSGGEIAAMVLIDAVVRLLPGVAGNEASLAEESFSSGLLEYPHYTRPREWEGRAIPEVLLSGNHAEIAKWRREQAESLTRQRRPDLWRHHGKRQE